ncbi:hypothetical protein D9Q98_000652 [Chlorella vulgaris]|uniref:Uncharacterized protein n=1 Tax=Chlorella vulgaris TaxID=3077 RepID=A0A9D4TYJ5_CHLVU|nr:hypothetical protein D9Q98_000652 [Chlorella vulgaris]
MAVSDTPGRILVLGTAAVDHHRLLASVTGQGSVQHVQDSHTWRLDNKYYSAEVQFDVRHVGEPAGPVLLDSSSYEAVLLVFDADHPASFDSVRHWYETAGGESVAIRLAVRTRAAVQTLGTGNEQLGSSRCMAEAESWCADQLVELVDASGVQQSEEADAAARAEGEAVGVQRIREALEAHMWPGLQLKPAPRHGLAASAADTPPEPAQRGAVQHAAPAAVAANGTHANNTSAEGLSFADYLRAPDEALAAAGLAGIEAGREDEEEVQQLDRLLASVAGHRTQLAQLPDDQRREAAAAMVMQLVAAMGLAEDEEEEEEAA